MSFSFHKFNTLILIYIAFNIADKVSFVIRTISKTQTLDLSYLFQAKSMSNKIPEKDKILKT